MIGHFLISTYAKVFFFQTDLISFEVNQIVQFLFQCLKILILAWKISVSHNFKRLTDRNSFQLVQISAAVPIMLKSSNCGPTT